MHVYNGTEDATNVRNHVTIAYIRCDFRSLRDFVKTNYIGPDSRCLQFDHS